MTRNVKFISGYSLFGEATPRLTHPIMYMHEYTRKADAEAARKYGDVQGRPNNMFYFSPIYYNGKGYFSPTARMDGTGLFGREITKLKAIISVFSIL